MWQPSASRLLTVSALVNEFRSCTVEDKQNTLPGDPGNAWVEKTKSGWIMTVWEYEEESEYIYVGRWVLEIELNR